MVCARYQIVTFFGQPITWARPAEPAAAVLGSRPLHHHRPKITLPEVPAQIGNENGNSDDAINRLSPPSFAI